MRPSPCLPPSPHWGMTSAQISNPPGGLIGSKIKPLRPEPSRARERIAIIHCTHAVLSRTSNTALNTAFNTAGDAGLRNVGPASGKVNHNSGAPATALQRHHDDRTRDGVTTLDMELGWILD